MVTIWEGFKDWFAAQGFAFDYVLYSGYEAQAEAHLAGDVDVTWDSPLAWVRTRRLAAAHGPRRTSRRHARHRPGPHLGRARPRRQRHLRGGRPRRAHGRHRRRRLAAGHAAAPRPSRRRWASTRPRPSRCAASTSWSPSTATTSAASARPSRALVDGEVDAACVIDGNQLLFAKEGTIPTGSVRVLTRTEPYDHCTMTVLDDVDDAVVDRFVELLLSMSFDDPAVRPLLELEGLTSVAARPDRGLPTARGGRRSSRLLRPRRLHPRRGLPGVTRELPVVDLGRARVRRRRPRPRQAGARRPPSGRGGRGARAPIPTSSATSAAWCRQQGHRCRAAGPDLAPVVAVVERGSRRRRPLGGRRAAGPPRSHRRGRRRRAAAADWGLAARGAAIEPGGPAAAFRLDRAPTSGPTAPPPSTRKRRPPSGTPPPPSTGARRSPTAPASRPPSCRS